MTSRTSKMVVEFHSDRGVTGPGFSATWRKVIIIIVIKIKAIIVIIIMTIITIIINMVFLSHPLS